jgi:hypothetical protein
LELILKEAINKLSNLTDDQIRTFTLEQASSCLELFNKMDKAVAAIWQVFKLLDTDTRDVRTLEIINNHASGGVIKSMKAFKAEMSSLFPVNPLEEEKGSSQLINFQTNANIYLEYNKCKTQLKNNQSLVEGRIQALHAEQTAAEPISHCRMQ